MLLVSNISYVKSLFSFPTDRQGASGTGKWCWSNGGGTTTKNQASDQMTLKSNFSVECGLESEANPQYNYEINNAFGSAVTEGIPALERNFPSDNWTNELMSDEDTKAVFETTPPNWSTPNTNSVYWLAGRPITPSVTVNANTETLDLRFLVSYGSVIWYSGVAATGRTPSENWHTDCDTTPCVGRIRVGGFNMNVKVE